MHLIITRMIVVSRYAMVPLLMGLIFALFLLVISFFVELWSFLTHFLWASETEILVKLLALIDLTLIGSLIVIVVFSGYENFVERIDRPGSDVWPAWMTKVTFSGLKQKLFASMMAICGVTLLKALMKLETSVSETQIKWLVIANLIFVLSYAVLTLTDYFVSRGHDSH